MKKIEAILNISKWRMLRKPEHAAGIPLAALTAWMALLDKADLRAGQSVLIHAASGGVGTFAVQLAKLAGARVGTTSGRNIDLVKSLGADEVIDYLSEDFSTRVKDVDVAFDTLGGDTQTKSFSVVHKGGVLVSIVDIPDTSVAQQHGVVAHPCLCRPERSSPAGTCWPCRCRKTEGHH
jgi:NADPH:quinone reductase-like Zn-dependent oxidoreductase